MIQLSIQRNKVQVEEHRRSDILQEHRWNDKGRIVWDEEDEGIVSSRSNIDLVAIGIEERDGDRTRQIGVRRHLLTAAQRRQTFHGELERRRDVSFSSRFPIDGDELEVIGGVDG